MSETTYIQEIQKAVCSKSKESWYELNWYLLHHKDVDLETAYGMYLRDDPEYTDWLVDNSITKLYEGESIEKVLLNYISDYIEVADTEGDVNIHDFFKEKEQIQEDLYGQKRGYTKYGTF